MCEAFLNGQAVISQRPVKAINPSKGDKKWIKYHVCQIFSDYEL